MLPAAAGTIQSQRVQVDFKANVTAGIMPLAVEFTSLSQAGVTNWTWSFGEGSGSYELHPVHLYERSGICSVRLIAVGPCNIGRAFKSRYVTVIVPNPLSANFTADGTSGAMPLEVRFTDTSSGTPNA